MERYKLPLRALTWLLRALPFGQRLHTLREQAGLSQQQLADRLGLTQRA